MSPMKPERRPGLGLKQVFDIRELTGTIGIGDYIQPTYGLYGFDEWPVRFYKAASASPQMISQYLCPLGWEFEVREILVTVSTSELTTMYLNGTTLMYLTGTTWAPLRDIDGNPSAARTLIVPPGGELQLDTDPATTANIAHHVWGVFRPTLSHKYHLIQSWPESETLLLQTPEYFRND